jgi:hypothetical protein
MTIIASDYRPAKAVDRPVTLWQLDMADTEPNRHVVVPMLRDFLDGTKHHILLQADMGVFMPARGDVEGDDPEAAFRITAQGAHFGTRGRDVDLSQVKRRFDELAEREEYRELLDGAHLEHIVPPALAD